MAKPTTQWTANASKNTPAIAYSSSSVTYNSPTTKYSGIDVTLAEDGSVAQSWSGVAKATSDWTANAAYDIAATYEPSGVTYDTIYSVYDGVSGESPIGTIDPVLWAATAKAISAWTANAAADAALYAYDSSTNDYDSGVLSYDGVTTGEEFSSTKELTTWAEV